MMMKDSLFQSVQDDLIALENQLIAVIHSPVHLITDIGTHLVQAGGKRLRPALYLLCAQKVQSAVVMPMALAIELIHMATLVHDDVIDHATTRRFRPTANACWGNHISVLSGDYLFAKAFSIVAHHSSGEMLKILTDVICSICEGEIIQIGSVFNPEQSEENYRLRIGQKTADFIAASCQLGAMSAGCVTSEVEALRQYGYALGMAFQLTDDILDITQTSEQIGKPVGNDLRQGIITLPVIYALKESADRDELRQIILKRDVSELKVQRGLGIILASHAIESSYRQASEYLAQAKASLPPSLGNVVRQELLAVADFVGLRKY